MSSILSKKAVLANITVRHWGTFRNDHQVTEDVLDQHKAKPHTGIFAKRLLVKGAMGNIYACSRAAKAYHWHRTLPWLQDGTRILPSTLFLEYAKEMKKYKQDFEDEVQKFCGDYPDHIEEAKRQLGRLYKSSDYPEIREVRGSFLMDVTIMPCPDSKDFRITLDEDDMENIRLDLETKMQHQMGVVLKNVGDQLVTVVGHMATRLRSYKPADKKNGKKAEGTFRDSLVENVKEIVALLPSFNLSADPKLDAIHKRMAKELCDADADALRDDDKLRKKVAKSADEILAAVKDFMT